jgi:hypothetical protein
MVFVPYALIKMEGDPDGRKDFQNSTAHTCPQCGGSMVATKVIRYRDIPGGMYWICPKDDQRVKV